MRVIHPVTGLTPAQILGDNETDGLDIGPLMQYRTAGMMALGIDMKKSIGTKSKAAELASILGAGIA